MVKVGSTSIILEPGEFGGYVKEDKDKIIKVTKVVTEYNDFTHLNDIKKIKNYKKYYSIPDEPINLLFPTDDFYSHIKNLVKDLEINIFGKYLIYFTMDKAGDKEVYDTIIDMTNNDLSIWDSYKTIINFSKFILEGLSFLHRKQISHLDIKAENIMVNIKKKTYKIIDFGFSSKYPFDDFISNIRGTPCYFPKQYKSNITSWFPKIYANDLLYIGNQTLIKVYRILVYNIDSFCLGRLLYYINYIYTEKKIYSCFSIEKYNRNKLNKIIESLIEPNTFERLSPRKCLNKFFRI